TTNRQVASKLLNVERYGLGFGYLDDYRAAVAAVTPEDVQAVAKKYLDPEHMVLGAVGAVDAEGKPLAKEPEEPQGAVPQALAPKGRQRIAKGVSPGVSVPVSPRRGDGVAPSGPKQSPNNYQGLRPSLFSAAPSGPDQRKGCCHV